MEKILLAVDGSNSSKSATEYVCKLFASGSPLEIHLLNVQETLLLRVAIKFSSEERENMYKDNTDKVMAQITPLFIAKNIPYFPHYANGEIAPVIAKIGEELACDRIVIGTGRRGCLAGLLFGSIAQKVIHYSNIPVTVVLNQKNPS